jgi:hypothetical protein
VNHAEKDFFMKNYY